MAANYKKILSAVALLTAAGSVSAHGLMSNHNAYQLLESPTFVFSLFLAMCVARMAVKYDPAK